MSNPNINTNDNGPIHYGPGEFQDELLTFAAADTFVAGTILARRNLVTAITPSAITGTGNGTLTAAAVVEGPIVPLVGSYVLTCILAVTHGGVFKLEDPNGALVADNLQMTASTGAATVFEVGGLTFTLTDGSTDFAAGAFFTLPVVAGGKLVPYNPAGVGGAQNPIAVLTYEVTKASSGDLSIRPLMRGTVNKDRLIIDVDGTGANVTAAVCDKLRAAGIHASPVKQLGALDNGAS